MKAQTSTGRLLTLFGAVAVLMLMVDWSLMRAIAFAVIWAVAAGVLVLRDRRDGSDRAAPVSGTAGSDADER